MAKKLDAIADTAPDTKMKHLKAIEGRIKETSYTSPKAELDVLYSFLSKYRHKASLTDKELEDASKDVIKALGYHIHRRHLRISKKAYEELAETRDSSGKSYAELIVYGQYQITKDELKENLKKVHQKGDKISAQDLLEVLKEPMQEHEGKIRTAAMGNAIPNLEYVNTFKKYIRDQVKLHPELEKDKYDVKNMTKPEDVFRAYITIMHELYGRKQKKLE